MNPESHDSSTFDWDELLLAIEDRELIPVVGRNLLVLEDGGETIEGLCSAAVADRLGLSMAHGHGSLNSVAIEYLRDAGSKAESKKRKLLKAVHEVATSPDLPIPAPLLHLAEIRQLSTFLTTTFDGLMLGALRQIRGGPDHAASALSYHIEDPPDDLPIDRGPSDAIVYHLFGSVETRTDFAVTEEDQLERLHRLQDPRRQPTILFDELDRKHLLFLGCGFPDGVARVLMRTLTNDRLFEEGRRTKVADRRVEGNADQQLFLMHCGAEWYTEGSAADFVGELVRRWRESGLADETEEQSASRVDRRAVSAGVFISYKSQDLDRVLPIASALTDARIPIWFDKKDIDGGEQWSAEIEKGLKNCTLFMPVLSTNAQVGESVVIREWKRALTRRENISKDAPFIVPVLLDQLDQLEKDEAGTVRHIPEEFFRTQAISIPDGGPDGSFVETVRERMREAQLARAGR